MTLRRLTPQALVLLSGPLLAGQAAAEACVGAAFERPFPGATGVETRHADVPSPRFPGLWQQGRINGDRFILYANGEATLIDGASEPAWTISVQCDLDAGTCTESAEGSPPEAAMQVARQLGRCFVAPDEVTAPVVPPPPPAPVAPPTEGWALVPGSGAVPAEPEDTTVEPTPAPAPEVTEPAPEPEPEPAAPPCGLATIPEGAPGLTLQRLLVEAGADPGPLDGLPGRMTRSALAQVLGDDARTLEIADAITALDAFLCKTGD